MSNPFRVDSCIRDKERAHCHSSACGHPAFPTPFIEETVPSQMRVLGTLVKNHLTEDMWVYFWGAILFPGHCVFMPVPCSFNYYSFEKKATIGNHQENAR